MGQVSLALGQDRLPLISELHGVGTRIWDAQARRRVGVLVEHRMRESEHDDISLQTL